MSSRTTLTQFSLMVDFMEKHGDLSKPTSLPNGRQWAIQMWKKLTEILNSQGVGEIRSEEKWRKVWTDLKNNTKRKWAKLQRSLQGTGGGPPLKMCLTDIENRVLGIIGVQAAVGMSVAEVGFGTVEQSIEVPTIESVSENVCEEYWNTPSTSNCEPTITSPMAAPRKSPTPSTSTAPHDTLKMKKKKKPESGKKIEDYFMACEENARKDARERENMIFELEKEKIRIRDIELRQRDTELQLQAQWQEIMKKALDLIETFRNK